MDFDGRQFRNLSFIFLIRLLKYTVIPNVISLLTLTVRFSISYLAFINNPTIFNVILLEFVLMFLNSNFTILIY